MLPSFVGIGAQRAGTTWIYQCLREHPEVFVPDKKELHFFSSNYSKGVEWYSSFFNPSPQHSVCGEITPNYLNAHNVPDRMRQVLPEVKIFAILRNPISRARSAYQLFYDQRYKGVSFFGACGPDSDIVKCGLYFEYLHPFYEYFPKDQIRIWIYEKVKNDPVTFYKELFEYIGVNQNCIPGSVGVRYNRVIFPRTQKVIRQIGGGALLDLVRATNLGNWIKNRHSKKKDIVELSFDQKKIIQEYFAKDIVKLEGLLGADLSIWRC